MKKNFVTLALLISSALLSFAQPIVNSYSPYYVKSHSVLNGKDIPLGNAGENQNWDFSSLVIGNLVADVITVPVETAPGHENFPLANFCTTFFSSNFNPPLENYNFFKITNTLREVLGTTNGQGDITLQYIDPLDWPLPFNYGLSYTSIQQTTNDTSPITSEVRYDAYGTLITPYGTYNNVVRIKTTNVNETNYFWAQIIPRYLPLMERTTRQFDTYFTLYEDISDLGVNQIIIDKQVMIYPNPSSKYINLFLPENEIAKKVLIFELSGKKILELVDNVKQFNIESLESGLYVIEVFSENKKYKSKFIKN